MWSLPENKHLRILLILLYLAIGIAAVTVFFQYLFPLLSPFFIAFAIAAIAQKPLRFLCKKTKIPKGILSVVLVTLIFSAISAGLFFAIKSIIFEVVHVIQEFLETAQEQMAENGAIMGFLKTHLPDMPDNILHLITDSTKKLSESSDTLKTTMNTAMGVVSGVPSAILYVVATCVATYLISGDYDKIRGGFAKQFPMKIRKKWGDIRALFLSTFVKYLRTQGILLVCTLVELTVGFLIMGFESAFALAVIIALVDALPVFGAGTVLIPWTVYSLVIADYRMAISLAILYIIITAVRNTLEPRLFGKQIGLHPLLSLLAAYVGFRVWGLLGVILLPIVMLLFIQIQRWGYIDVLLGKKRTQEEKS